MDNFYKESKEFLELQKELKEIDPVLAIGLTDVVEKAIGYGMERIANAWKASRGGLNVQK